MARIRVPIYNSAGKYATIETDPSLGATLGVDLYYQGRLLDPREILNTFAGGNTFVSTGGSSGGGRPPVGQRIRSTDELDEGRFNLYFTVERAQDAVGGALASSANVTLTYNDGSNTITADLTDTGVTPGTYGDSTHVAVFTVDAKGRITSVTQEAISGGGGTVEWGDITGTLSDQTDLQLALNGKDALGSAAAALQSALDAINRMPIKRAARVVTAAPLPSCTYDNGTGGVGATLTATANGALTVNGVALSIGDYVLVNDQAAPEENGNYLVQNPGSGGFPFVLIRGNGMDEDDETLAALVTVGPEGTFAPSSLWICTTPPNPTIGTDPITFVQFTGGGVTYTDTGMMFSNGSLDSSASAVGTTSVDEVRAMSVGAYNYASKDWFLWVSPTPASGSFELDVFKRSFGNTLPSPSDSICGSAYPSLAGNGSDFTGTGDTTGWAGTAIGVGDMLVVRPRTNTAGVKHWVFFLKVRRTF